jgi:hypothetical protein
MLPEARILPDEETGEQGRRMRPLKFLALG